MRLSIGLKLAFWLGLFGTLSSGLTGYYVYQRSRALLIDSAKEKLLTATRDSAQRFDAALKATVADVDFLAGLALNRAILEAEPTTKPTMDKARLAEIFSGLLVSHPEYSQIRLIDSRHFGLETVRADRDQSGVKVIEAPHLQEKNHFPYVFETAALPAGQVYISEINLNQELGTHLGYGQPTIRVAAPVKSAAGTTLGVLVINVDLADLFKRLRDSYSGDSYPLLVNRRGDYLIHPDPAKAFSFERGRPVRIQNDIPDTAPLLNGSSRIAVLSDTAVSALGVPYLAAFARQDYGAASEGRFVVLGLYTPLDVVSIGSKTLSLQVIRIALSLSLLVSLVSLLLAKMLAKPLQAMTKAIGQFQLGLPLADIPVDRNDEIGHLARLFRALAEQLNGQIAEIHASEAKLHAILNNAPVGIWLVDTNGRYAFVNQTFCQALGIPESRFLHTSALDELLGTDMAARFEAADQRCLSGGLAPHLSQEQLTFVDGESHSLEISRTKLLGLKGEVLGIIGIATDISDRKHAADRERAHNRVLERLAKSLPLADILEAVVEGIETQNPALLCSILLLDAEGSHLLVGAAPHLPEFYNCALHGLRIGFGVGSCGTAAVTGDRVIIEDIQSHPYWTPYRELAAKAGLASCWSEPVRDAGGKLLGTLTIYQRQPALPTPRDLQMTEQAANLTGIAIEHCRANEELRLASLVYQNSSEAMAVTDALGSILAINPAFSAITGYTPAEVIGQNYNILNSDRQDYHFYQTMWHAINASGHWKGEIWNRRKNGEVFVQWLTVNTIFNEDGSPHRRVALFSDITEKKQTEELIWTQANFDPLTGLPNRRMFHDRLDQELKKAHRTGRALALIFLDLDRFKEINDTLGHDMGDLLLKDAAQRLLRCVRESDTVARLGGDEFTIILGELDDTEHVERIVVNLLQKLAEPFQLKAKVAYLSASIGITLFPKDGDKIHVLIKNADQAMYAAKHQGRNRYCYFTPSMQEAAQIRMEIAGDLRGALGADQFQLYYQPIVDLATGVVYKAEALLRWQHPLRGWVSPAEFVPIAEDIGIINEIGDWVFKQAAERAKLWRQRFHADFQISINKSPVQFHDTNQTQRDWPEHLRQLGLPGAGIIVEITEGLLLDASNDVKEQLLSFRDNGIQVALDDFGTGYSSLAYLKKFDIDYLKIDRSFVSNLGPESSDRVLCEAIIAMAHKLGMKVVAEGIETEEQHRILVESGCDFGQGFLFSQALPAEAFEARLAGGPAEFISISV
ncbi:EAL domain-containing protein [Methylomonas sp. UP202]|uniref:bifunctional diguanylate cyclase/phosphodiesterase n=1 Tax=Methylomonas sp. UP202 TaxID=3040943 RepID=UPI002479ED92|nr:EAL domain-containing protein [Methylomonas sp. UP202]WGS85348.1 EAL domain-containing protein [Methylomonas sp. UP202]